MCSRNEVVVVRTLTVWGILFLLTAGCAMNGSLPASVENFSVSTLEKDDPEKSYGETVLEKISGGNVKRRVIGWIDRAS
jgi:hypothetical protein